MRSALAFCCATPPGPSSVQAATKIPFRHRSRHRAFNCRHQCRRHVFRLELGALLLVEFEPTICAQQDRALGGGSTQQQGRTFDVGGVTPLVQRLCDVRNALAQACLRRGVEGRERVGDQRGDHRKVTTTSPTMVIPSRAVSNGVIIQKVEVESRTLAALSGAGARANF